MNKTMHLSKEKIIAIYIFIMGFVLSVLIPTWEVPDERSHLNMIGYAVGIDDLDAEIEEDIALDWNRVEFNYDEKVDMDQQMEALTESAEYERGDLLPKGISLSIIKHLPSVIGVEFGILLHLPVYWVLMLGEWFSLLFYTMVCYLALKIMPVKKEILAFVMLFPMAIQQAGSLSYDAMLLPLCFLFVAYVFHLKYEKEIVGLKEMLILLGIWLVITYIKAPSVFIILLILLIPLQKYQIRIGKFVLDEKWIKKLIIPVGILGIVMVGAVGYLFRENVWIQLVTGYVLELRRGLWLFYQTKYWKDDLIISTVGNFGWLDTPVSMTAANLVFLMLTFFALTREKGSIGKEPGKWERIILLVVFGILCGFTAMAMTHHTIMVILFGSEAAAETYNIREALYQIPYIGGLQGRYFLPFVPMLFLLLPQKIEVNSKIRNIAFAVTEIALYAYVIVILLQRFWWA